MANKNNHLERFCKKCCSETFCKIHRKPFVTELIFNNNLMPGIWKLWALAQNKHNLCSWDLSLIFPQLIHLNLQILAKYCIYLHYVKNVQIRIYYWNVFSCIQSEHWKIRTRNNSVFGHFPHSVTVSIRILQILTLIFENSPFLWNIAIFLNIILLKIKIFPNF